MPVFTQGKCSADAAIASPDNDHTCHCSDFDEDAAVFLGGIGVQVIAGGRCFNLARGHVEDRGMFGCVRLTDASAAGASPAERKGSHHFHREPCAGHREVSGEASVAACTASLVTGLTGESPVGVILSLTP